MRATWATPSFNARGLTTLDDEALFRRWTPSLHYFQLLSQVPCRRLKPTRFVPLSASRHCRAGLSYPAASRLGPRLFHRSPSRSSFVKALNDARNAAPTPGSRECPNLANNRRLLPAVL